MDSNSDSYSLSIPQSIRSETKEKFDALLKNALKKAKREQHQSKEKLISEQESTTASSEHLVDREVYYEPDNNKGDNFILNKFLNDPEIVGNYDTLGKPPIPKPRKKVKNNLDSKRGSISSQETFNVVSPKIIHPKNIEDKGSDSNSQRTYVKNDNQIGDVILHDSPKTSKISVISNVTNIIEKADSEKCEKELEPTKIQNLNEDIEEAQSESGKSDIYNEPEPSSQPITNKNGQEKVIKSLSTQENIKYQYEKITEIIVHRTDKLLIKSFLIHPVVNIHVINIENGKYYLKSNKERSVVFFYENEDTDYILPVMTGCFNLQEKRTFYPSWEEKIIINEDFEYLASDKVIYFFEILDFQAESNKSKNSFKETFKGWYKICFAYLKPIGKNSARNLNKKLRLQLYYACDNVKTAGDEFYLWKLWKTNKLKKYPSTLYITIKSIAAPDKILNVIRSKTPLQQERSADQLLDERAEEKNEENVMSIHTEISRLSDLNKSLMKSGGKYQIPNHVVTKFDTYDDGCFVHKFSNNGKYLAAAVKIDDLYSVVVYSMEELKEIKKYTCHQGLIYAVIWSHNDALIITCSADNTISIWEFNKDMFSQILPHPTFVYTIDINFRNIISSGCFDGIIRIWMKDDNSKYDLHEELNGHQGFITSLCFDKQGKLLFSSSSTGELIIWEISHKNWLIKDTLNIFELKNTIINKIILFPNEKKILVHSRDSTLRIISSKNKCILHWLHGALNERVQITSTITHCGNYVISGSENGIVNIWNAKTGECEKTFTPFENLKTNLVIHSVDCNSSHNLLCVASQTAGAPLIIYDYEEPIVEQSTLQPRTKFTISMTAEKFQKKIDLDGILQRMDEILH